MVAKLQSSWLLLPFLQLMLVPLTVFAAKAVDKTVQLRTHSIYAPYIDQDLQNRWWDFGADTYINTNKHIRLTRAKPSQMGWLWSRLPLTVAHYVIEVEFKVGGDNKVHGDGFALWLTKKRAQPGPVFGSVDNFEGLALFFDTYANSRHSYDFPRVVAMLGDGQTRYDLGNDGEVNSIASCSANFRQTNVPTKFRLTYVKDGYLELKIQYKAWDQWEDCFRIEGVTIPQSPFLGFSALTGDVSDNHDIISVTTSSAILADASHPRNKLGPGASEASSSSSWTWFFVKLFAFVGVCVGGFYGYQNYYVRGGAGRMGGFGSGGMGIGGFRGAGDMFASGKRF